MARWAPQGAAEERGAGAEQSVGGRSLRRVAGSIIKARKTFDRDQRGGFSWPSHYQHQQQRRKTEVTCNEAQSISWAFCLSVSPSSPPPSSSCSPCALLFSFSSAVVVFFGYFVFARIGVSKFRFNEFYQRDSLTKIDCHFVCWWERERGGEWAAG